MPKYTFTLKKDDIFVEFTTTDKALIERQFQIWVTCASVYSYNLSRKQKPFEQKSGLTQLKSAQMLFDKQEKQQAEVEKPQIVDSQTEEIQSQQSEIVEIIEQPKEEIQQGLTEEKPVTQVEEEILRQENQPEIIEEVIEIKAEENPEVFDKASDLLKTINNINNPQAEVKAQESVNFESILEKKIENPTFEPKKAKDERFLKVITSKNSQDKLHYFIITAYYLLEFEKMERFSLKQINAKLMQNLSELIDHTVLQDALDKNLVELVPDLTGMSDVAEYKLTDLGEEFFTRKI